MLVTFSACSLANPARKHDHYRVVLPHLQRWPGPDCSMCRAISDPESASVRRAVRRDGRFAHHVQTAHPSAHHGSLGTSQGRRQRGDHPGLQKHRGRRQQLWGQNWRRSFADSVRHSRQVELGPQCSMLPRPRHSGLVGQARGMSLDMSHLAYYSSDIHRTAYWKLLERPLVSRTKNL